MGYAETPHDALARETRIDFTDSLARLTFDKGKLRSHVSLFLCRVRFSFCELRQAGGQNENKAKSTTKLSNIGALAVISRAL
jgi:hypothetical protein